MFMKNKSIWLDEKNKLLKKVTKDLECDVLIVGGGITGLSTLYQLHKNKVNAILIEKNKCGEGITSKSTAKITYLQEKEYLNIRKFGNLSIANKYLKSQMNAVNILKNIITKENIVCDLLPSASILFTNDLNKKDILFDEYKFLKNAGVNVELLKEQKEFKLALKVQNTYVFHPLKYLLGLKNILQDYIYENSPMKNFTKEKDFYICNVNKHFIKSKYLIIATHYPYFIYPLFLPFKSHVETSYIGAIKVKEIQNVNAINIDKPTISYRYHRNQNNNYLIYLFNSYPSYNIKNIQYNFDDLLSKYNFNYIWSNKDIITSDYIPLIGKVNQKDDTLLIACGYNTWGMTNGTLAGVILKDLILKNENEYIELFNPHRDLNLNKITRFPVDACGSLKAILKSNQDNVNNSKIIYTKIHNKDVAIYKDENNKEHIVLNKCPHMKCGLVFNAVEKTWDCLCHGSRYDLDGKCLEGPSNYDITYKGTDINEEK